MSGLSGLQKASLALLVLLAVVCGLYLKRATLLITETQIIETYAAEYLSTNPAARETDCSAVPGQAYVRMVVICGPEPFDATRHFEYHVGYLGGLIRLNGPGDWKTTEPVAPRFSA